MLGDTEAGAKAAKVGVAASAGFVVAGGTTLFSPVAGMGLFLGAVATQGYALVLFGNRK
jgi:uncharacterized Ntn-hydrolase superfamily protein